MKSICAQVSDNGIEETLQHIPRDIDATYERILDLIDKKPSVQRELARKALLYIAHATEPVSIDILALAIAVKDHTQSLDTLRSSISAKEKIFDACGNLLSVDNTDPNNQRVCFIHFSVHEFLTNSQSKLRLLHTLSLELEMAHREIARMCMNFLLILYSQIQDYCTDIESSFANHYILPALPHHLLAGNLNSLPPNDEMVNLTLLFFEKGPPMLIRYDLETVFFTFSLSVLALIFNLPGTHQCYNPQVLCEQQLDLEVLNWIHGGLHKRFSIVADNRLAVHYAIGQLDSVAVAERLHTYKYPIEYSYHDSDGLSHMGHTWPGQQRKVLEFCRLTPLYLVKSEEVARLLLDKGASLSPQIVDYELPNLLGHLAKGGNTKVIQLLLDRNAEQDEEAQSSALQSLAYHGKVEAIRFLLENGVDIHARGGEYDTALHAAAWGGKVEAIRLLLDDGMDVNTQSEYYGNALQAAASCGEVEAMRFLLDRGADFNAQSGELGNPLQAAAENGNIEAMKLLLDKGANVNVGNTLKAAARSGNIEAMLLLLDNGADIGNSAADSGNIEAMQLLLDKGADIQVQGGFYGNALQAAASHGSIKAMQFLLDRGMDVNARGGYYGNPLRAAADNGRVMG